MSEVGRWRGRKAPLSVVDAWQVLQSSLSAAVLDIKQPRVMVTSPNAGEGKTTTCLNLAYCFARAGYRVMALDLDLRHPDIHQLIGAHNRFGLIDAVMDARPPQDCLQSIDLPGPPYGGAGSLYFLAAGPVSRNPAELLSLNRTSKVLDEMAEQADIVLIDAPPVLTVADALVIGRMVSGALLVVQAHRTTLPELIRAKDLLIRNTVHVLGVALNRFDPRDRGLWELPENGVDADGTPA
jgi:protein-tyrosine kinase